MLGFALASLQFSPAAVAQPLPVAPPPQAREDDRAAGENSEQQDRDDRRANAEDMELPRSTLFDPLRLESDDARRDRQRDDSDLLGRNIRLRPPPKPNEFETYVKDVTGREIRRFGQELLLEASRDFAMPATTTVPPDYRLNPGDTVVL